ncbi:MAG TPA: hypothetical protein VFG30_06145 [Polyangiales bacterium]|nr:hypothetical protein [Polyangiales bacterium]
MRTSLKTSFSLLVLSLLSIFTGCEDDLPKVTLITHMRALGARQEVIGDEARAIPKPGERVRMTWAMAYPDVETTDDELASFFIECTAPIRYTGTPVCQEFIDAAQGRTTGLGFGFSQPPEGCDVKPDSTQTIAGIRLVCVTGTPKIDVPVAKAAKSPRLVQGIICRNGIPQLDLESPTGASCKPKSSRDDFEEITVYGTVNIATKADEENENPAIAKAKLRLRATEFGDPIDWNPTPAEALPDLEEDCSTASSEILPKSPGFTGVILIDYPKQTASRERDEDIVFSTYATFGELSRRFTVFESTGVEVDAPKLTWKLSEEERTELVGNPRLVRFYFTVVDGRGGFDITTRELCVDRL